ncbi:MAG: hypothetical protein ACXWHB_01895 [Usitatibacter sp.]
MDCWHHEIDHATTEREVVRSAADYLFLWAPQELAPLTLGWRDLRCESAEDVERIKQWLVEGMASTHSASPFAPALRELASYFWHAAFKIQELRRSRLRLVVPALHATSPLFH